ncbi:PREDICTED: thiopurine S-methyltransferase isoform X3 [Cyprinodon variegatus]|uniref:thiopurine S-methyltransferase isoform X3 n=1 Tax=Cyprinodon variegatus TaxID=28743 RepID=UPI000742678A|nr:PREDICTED: thiopurine S-methyltransferase isoform X3 [Cyprinodon variegatus]
MLVSGAIWLLLSHVAAHSLAQRNFSSMLEQQANRTMELSEWEQRWQENRTGFHQLEVHKLADLGHSVVGVEISEMAIRQFFQENNLTYSEESVPSIPGAKLFQNTEKSISLYQCDLFSFSSSVAGQFGAIWDRGSLVAINPKDRDRYAALILSLMAADCRYLLDTFLYNPDLYEGPPFFVPDEQVLSLFGSSCTVELLQSEDALNDKWRNWGLDSMIENVHLITLKAPK